MCLVGIYWIYEQRVCIFFLHVETTSKQFYAEADNKYSQARGETVVGKSSSSNIRPVGVQILGLQFTIFVTLGKLINFFRTSSAKNRGQQNLPCGLLIRRK